jgi:hypothetical protein
MQLLITGRPVAFAALVVIASTTLSACSRAESTWFKVANNCDVVVDVSVFGDQAGPTTMGVIGVEPGTRGTYAILSSSLAQSIRLVVIPEIGRQPWPDRSRDVAVPTGTAGGSGSKRDPYMLIVDGELCRSGA